MFRHDWEAREQAERLAKVRERHVRAMSKGQQILFRIASDEDSSYESEYDGINDSYCRYCDANLSRGTHDEDCDIYEAREALGDVWTNYVNAYEAEEKAIREENERKMEEERRKHEKVPCPNCGKQVKRIGLKSHRKSDACRLRKADNTMRKHEERTGIKCITDVWINYDGPRCHQCTKPMPNAHPNKKFCSNTGAGNCKDKFHNRQPHRIERSKAFAPQRKPTSTEVAIMMANDWRMNGESWDEHKDCF